MGKKKYDEARGRDNRKPKDIPKVGHFEIHLPELPKEEERVTISLSKLLGLYGQSQTLEIVRRYAEHKVSTNYGVDTDELLALLGVAKLKGEGRA